MKRILALIFMILSAVCLSTFAPACTSSYDPQDAADVVIQMIDNLPEEDELTLDDEQDVIDTRDCYDDLTSREKGLVTNLNKLLGLEDKIEELRASKGQQKAQAIIDQINALPEPSQLTLQDKAWVQLVRANFNALTITEKGYVTNVLTLVQAELTIEELENSQSNSQEAQAVITAIENLPDLSEISLDDEDDVVAVRTQYNALSEGAKIYVTNYAKLQSLEGRITALKEQLNVEDVARAVEDKIDALPTVQQLTLADKSKVVDARQSYEYLSAQAKPLVTNLSKLESLEAQIIVLENDAQKLAEAQAVIDQIDALPTPETLTLSEKSSVEGVRTAYNSLSAEVKTLVTNIQKLIDLEAKLQTLQTEENYKNEAKPVIQAIANLPSIDQITLDDEQSVISVRGQYDSLSSSAKVYVTNLSTLTNLEDKIEQLKNQKLDGFMTTDNPSGYTLQDGIYTITGAGNYILKGELTDGQIFVNAPELNVNIYLDGVIMTSTVNSIIFVEDANKVTIYANDGTVNTLTDLRPLKTVEDLAQGSAPIYAKSDLSIDGTGTLNVTGSYYNAIHTKNDLRIHDLTLTAKAPNNALKGADSITIDSGNITAISTGGNGLKTDNSDVSTKGNQRGTISITGGTLKVYAATDGIDAAYNVEIDGASTVVEVYTDKYSEYTENIVTGTTDGTTGKTIYINSYYSSDYRYAIKFYNDATDSVFVNATLVTTLSSGRANYSLTMPNGYTNFNLYRYSASQAENSETEYLACSGGGTINTSKDLISINGISGTTLTVDWGTYSSSSSGSSSNRPGMGGMQEGNTDKSTYSTKGIKADNIIDIKNGTIKITSNDDAIHSSYGLALLNGATGLGIINISGGDITVSSQDDGIHADHTLNVLGGKVTVTTSYEGLEADLINISGGKVKVYATDDGLNAAGNNATATITVSGGYVDVTVGSGDTDTIDSNATYVQTGGFVIAKNKATGGMSSVLDVGGDPGSANERGSISITGGTFIGCGSIEGTTSYGVKYKQISSTCYAGDYTISNTDISFTLEQS